MAAQQELVLSPLRLLRWLTTHNGRAGAPRAERVRHGVRVQSRVVLYPVVIM